MQAHSCMAKFMPWTTRSTLYEDNTNAVWNPTQHNRRLHSRKKPQHCTRLVGNGNVHVTDRDALCVDKTSELPAGIVPNSTQLQDPVLG